jgi:hypothetical protein
MKKNQFYLNFIFQKKIQNYFLMIRMSCKEMEFFLASVRIFYLF